MKKEIVRIELTEEYKKEAINLINSTIEYVLKKQKCKLNDYEKLKIKNFSLDQINVNISNKSRSKTMWIFDAEENVPVIVCKEKKLKAINVEVQENENCKFYKINTNLTWDFSKDNHNNGGITHEEFKKRILELLLEDFETAAFYGTLSYVNDKETDDNECE